MPRQPQSCVTAAQSAAAAFWHGEFASLARHQAPDDAVFYVAHVLTCHQNWPGHTIDIDQVPGCDRRCIGNAACSKAPLRLRWTGARFVALHAGQEVTSQWPAPDPLVGFVYAAFGALMALGYTLLPEGGWDNPYQAACELIEELRQLIDRGEFEYFRATPAVSEDVLDASAASPVAAGQPGPRMPKRLRYAAPAARP